MSAEARLEDTRVKLKEAKKQSRLADTVEAQKAGQEAIKQLEKQMHKRSSSHYLFRIRWRLI